MTKKRKQEVARQARRWGYYANGDGSISVKCPQCGERVETRRAYLGDGKLGRETVPRALDRAMVEHLGDCAAAAA